jgi:hypothetical protein
VTTTLAFSAALTISSLLTGLIDGTCKTPTEIPYPWNLKAADALWTGGNQRSSGLMFMTRK